MNIQSLIRRGLPLLVFTILIANKSISQNRLYFSETRADGSNISLEIFSINTFNGDIQLVETITMNGFIISPSGLFGINEDATEFYFDISNTFDEIFIVRQNNINSLIDFNINNEKNFYYCSNGSFWGIGFNTLQDSVIIYNIDTTLSNSTEFTKIMIPFTNKSFITQGSFINVKTNELILTFIDGYIVIDLFDGSSYSLLNPKSFTYVTFKYDCVSNYTVASFSGGYMIFDYSTGNIIDSIRGLGFLNFELIGSLLYIYNSSNGDVLVYNLNTSEFEETIKTNLRGNRPLFAPFLCNPQARFSAQPDCQTPQLINFKFTGNAGDFFWDFGDTTTLGDTSLSLNPSYLYPDTGFYDVRLITRGCVSADTFDSTIYVPPLPPRVTFSLPDTVRINCNGSVLLEPINDQGGTFYRWSTGDVQRSITVSDTGLYWLIYENQFCSSRDTVIVLPNQDGQRINDTVFYCSPTDTILWQGQSITAPGNYLQTTGSAPCIDSLQLTVIDNQLLDTTLITICSGDSISIDGTSYKTPTIVQQVVPNFAICDSFLITIIDTLPRSISRTDTSICGGERITFNGRTITSPGIYRDTLINSFGCDSIVVLNLDPLPRQFTNEIVLVCPGDSVSFKGITYGLNQTFKDTLIAINSCDSIITYRVDTLPKQFTNRVDLICPDDSVIFNGTTYFALDNYLETYTGINGCDSLVSVFLDTLPRQFTNDVVFTCPGDSVIFKGITYGLNQTFKDTLIGINSCDSIITYTVDTLPRQFTNRVDLICPDDSVIFNGITYFALDNYVETYAGINGCDSLVSVFLDTLPRKFTNDIVLVCPGDSFSFTGINYGLNDQFKDTLIGINSCDSIVTYRVDTIPRTYSNFSTSICGLSPITFGGQVITATGDYFDTLTNAQGCDSIIKLTVSNVILDTNFINNSLCTFDTIGFTQSQKDSLNRQDTVQGIFGGCAELNLIRTTILFPNRIRDTVELCPPYLFRGQDVSGIDSIVDTSITAQVCPELLITYFIKNRSDTINLQTNLCRGGKLDFNGRLITAEGNYSDTLSNVFGCDSIVNLQVDFLPYPRSRDSIIVCEGNSFSWQGRDVFQAGLYSDTIQTAEGCDSIVELALDVKQLPVIEFDPESIICPGEFENVVYDYFVEVSTEIEVVGGNLITSTDTTIIVNWNRNSPKKAIRIIATDGIGCQSEIVREFQNIDSTDQFRNPSNNCPEIALEFQVPNVITPNNDGFNDQLIIPNLEFYQPLEITIYDRWGREIYSNQNYTNDWGPDAPGGTYYYQITYANQVVRGWVMVVRG